MDTYRMSFTTGGLFQNESVKFAELYLKLENWDVARDEIIRLNLLQFRTISSSKRVCREIISRLKTLSLPEMVFFSQAGRQDQAYLLWLAVCRRYQFIAEFAIEVMRERFITLKSDLNPEDFDSFFNKKSEWHRELDEIQPSTKSKLRQVLFRMMREAGLLTEKNIIIPAMLSLQLVDLILETDRQQVTYFPCAGS